MNSGKGLLMQMMDLLVEINKHCESMSQQLKDKSGKCACVNCCFSRYFKYTNSGCIYIQIKDEGLLEDIFSTMDYHNIDSSKYTDKFNDIDMDDERESYFDEI